MTTKAITIRVEVQCFLRWDEETRSYLSHCPALDLFSQGRTEENAKRAIEATIVAFIGRCYEKGTLNAVLKKYGFQSISGHADSQPGTYSETIAIFCDDADLEPFSIDVPIPLIAAQNQNTSYVS